jgi:hypothetical protein
VPRATRKSRPAALAFDALSVEGALIAPAMLARIAEQKAGGQAESDYSIPKGLTLRDEIARYFRIGQALFTDLRASATPAAAATTRFVEGLLRDAFGFGDISRVGDRVFEERLYVVTLEARGGRVPVVVVPPSDNLDVPSAHLPSEGRRRSAASAVQDWLNASDGALWGLCSNGIQLRLVRDNASLTRPAFIEADLRRIFEGEAFADFAALWLLIHASRFGTPGAVPTDCALERWREAGAKEGITARERLRGGVEAALLSLGGGFVGHPDNAALRERLASGSLPLPDYFGQLLRLVYRLIFLLAAEDRNLLHPPTAPAGPRKLYAEGYSVGRLRDHAVRRAAWDRHRDQWEGLLIAFAALADGEPRLGLPALGGLFEPGTIPELVGARLANRDLMEAIYPLAWLKEPSGLVPVNWRDMETEELGSVYEGLLELTPRLIADGHGFAFAEAGEAKGNARKTTGSYYTPDSLVQALLDSALDPVLDRVEAEADDPANALLSVTVVDPACGSGHFLLAAARRIATRVARHRAGGVASAEDYCHALREVARACIHGVDRNPLAVELTKVALWIETVEPGKPLGFLDANIRCGDSLLGVFDLDALRHGIPDAAYKPLTGDDKETARYFGQRNKAERAGQGSLDFARGGGRLPAAAPLEAEARALRAMPEDSPEEIAAKRRRFAAGRSDPKSWSVQIAADLYTAAFLAAKTDGVPVNRQTVTIPTTAHVWDALAGRTVYGPLVGRAQDLAGQAHAFHWPLEFPDVMAAGGFDVVLGNPPWEVMQLGEEEYFASRLPEIAELAGVGRKRAIAALEAERPEIFAQYEADKRRFESGNEFARASGRFVFSARGKVNTYGLFAELFTNLTGPFGRAGVIVPTGIATDSTTAPFFASLVNGNRLAQLTDFENRDAIFQAVHRSYKFSLLVIGRDVTNAGFAFFLTDPTQLHESERRFSLSAEDIARINPNTKTAPVFRSRADAELTAKIYARVPILIEYANDRSTDPWQVEFRQGLFNKTADSELFQAGRELIHAGLVRAGTNFESANGEVWLPVYEGNHGYIYDHRLATFEDSAFRMISDAAKSDLDIEVEAEIFILKQDYVNRIRRKGLEDYGYWLAIRRVARSTDERTVIGAVIPGGPATYGWLIAKQPRGDRAALLCANLNALVFDYCMRVKLSQPSIPLETLYQLPFVPPHLYCSGSTNFIVCRVLELTYTSHSMAPFARDLGYDGPPFAWDEDRRAQLRAELDAWYARAYGLTRGEMRYILDPADVRGPNYPSETFRVLKKNEIARYGEYRTARLVLAAWDAQEARPAAQ